MHFRSLKENSFSFQSGEVEEKCIATLHKYGTLPLMWWHPSRMRMMNIPKKGGNENEIGSRHSRVLIKGKSCEILLFINKKIVIFQGLAVMASTSQFLSGNNSLFLKGNEIRWRVSSYDLIFSAMA